MSASAFKQGFATFPLAPQRCEPPSSSPSSKKRRTQAWLALHLRDWSLHAALDKLSPERRALFDTQAVAVLDEDRQRRVLACNDQALRRGIRPGHTLNAALALCAAIQVLPRDTQHEARLLERLADWAQQYTPAVSLELPDELLLEVRGSLRLFGGAATLIAQVAAGLRAQHINARVALSATARSALWMARVTQSQCIAPPIKLKAMLATTPVQCLHWPPETEIRLARFGVQTLGDLLRLPRADLACRIGRECMRELDWALGRRKEIRTSHRPPQRYEDGVLLDFEVGTTAVLEEILIRRLEFLQCYLQSADLALARLRIDLIHREKKLTPLCIGLAAPTADMRHVARLLREHLMQLALPAPVLELRLRVQRLFVAEHRSIHLFQKGEGDKLGCEERKHRLLEQLRARLGNDAVTGWQLRADHRPERTQVRVRAETCSASSMPLPEVPARPLWLLDAPQRLSVGSPPSGMHLLRGPERIVSGWWDREPVARDYYVARDAQGKLCWIFMELVRCPVDKLDKPEELTKNGKKFQNAALERTRSASLQWFVHGWFG